MSSKSLLSHLLNLHAYTNAATHCTFNELGQYLLFEFKSVF